MGVGHTAYELNSPWMQRTPWAEAYSGVNLRFLHSLTHMPDMRLHKHPSPHSDEHTREELHDGYAEWYTSPLDHEKRLLHITHAIDWLLNRCEDTISTTSWTVLCWLLSTRAIEKGCPPRPFRFVGREVTKKHYGFSVNSLLLILLYLMVF